MRRAVLLAMVLSGVAGSDALAQADAPLQPGQRVRVRSTAYTPELTGVIEAIRPDTLVVRNQDRSVPTAVPLATVDRLQVSHGRHSHWMTGAAIGFGVGAASGAAIGAASGEDWLFTSSENAFLGAILFAPIGAVTGTPAVGDRLARSPRPDGQSRARRWSRRRAAADALKGV